MRPIKPSPVKNCEHCGNLLERKRFRSGVLECSLAFRRRKYCNRSCMAAAFDAKPTTGTSWSTGHYHARKAKPTGDCERCGKPSASDVHHEDRDFLNNMPDNLERICRSCHNREHHSRGSCTICGEPQKGLGYCNKHYIRFKKYGDPLASRILPRSSCSVCGQPANAKGMCGKHYMQAKRAKRKEVQG